MPVETFGYLDSLNPSYPDVSDGVVNGDDHIRGIKNSLKSTFPGLVRAASRVIGASWGFQAGDGTAAAPSYTFESEPTLGIYRPSAGVLGFLGRLLGDGAVEVGSIHTFIFEPAGFAKTSFATGARYLEMNGATYNTADYPRLAAAWGIGSSQFSVPNWTDTGRFLRSRGALNPVGTTQSNAIKTHAMSGTGVTDSQGFHAHNVSGSTGFMDRADPHSHTETYWANGSFGLGFSTGGNPFQPNASQATSAASINHAHSVAGSTDATGTHSHNVAVNSTYVGETETRPEAYSVIFAIKT